MNTFKRCSCDIKFYINSLEPTIGSTNTGAIVRFNLDRNQMAIWHYVTSIRRDIITGSEDFKRLSSPLNSNHGLFCDKCGSTVFTLQELRNLYDIYTYSNNRLDDIFSYCIELFPNFSKA